MRTKYVIIHPDGSKQTGAINWPVKPIGKVSPFVRKILGDDCWPEHVRVMKPEIDGVEPADMFVDEDGIEKNLPRNEAATKIYRAWSLRKNPDQEPEGLPAIYGIAVLFDRPVWF